MGFSPQVAVIVRRGAQSTGLALDPETPDSWTSIGHRAFRALDGANGEVPVGRCPRISVDLRAEALFCAHRPFDEVMEVP